jgi:hypothetical protein
MSQIQMPDLTNIFIELVIAVLAGTLASFIAIPLCKRFGLIDNPGTAPHKQHARPTPLAGGLVIGMGLMILILAYPGLISGKMLWAVIAAAIILAFGMTSLVFRPESSSLDNSWLRELRFTVVFASKFFLKPTCLATRCWHRY